MNTFNNNIDWYQHKIGDHDKQFWEQNVDGKIQATIDRLPKRDFDHSNKSRELLDIDLIKGYTFTKAQPSHTSYIRTWKGLVRMLFLPLFYMWWIKHTTWKFFLVAFFLYIFQFFVIVVYLYSPIDSSSTTASLFEVTNPMMFMFVLSVMHTQIVYTQSSGKTHHYKKTSSTVNSAPPTIKRSVNLKRVKKSVSKPLRRKAKTISATKENITQVLSTFCHSFIIISTM